MANPVYRRYTVATTELGPQAPVYLDWLPITHTTVAVWLAGAATYSVEATLDDINPVEQGGQAGSANPARWFTLAEFPAATAASKYAAIHNPWLWMRINISAITDPVEFKIQQAFAMGPRG